jgi:glycosyltransferase involved in cell wall biosynthesis
MGKNNQKLNKKPFISVCTPTFNRRPFIPIMIQCFQNQTYPKDKIEWIIIDDGTDKIEDLVSHIPQVKYFKFDEKMTLGRKRNIGNEKSKGDIIIYMDDDDYYPSDRFSHAVDVLKQNPKALCAGSSAMFIHFKHINKMYQFGPYGKTHSTAATFAFRKELLNQTKFDEESSVAEEKKFLKDYTIPFAQLDPKKSILVFSHNHNSFDKKELLQQMPNPYIHEILITPDDLVKEKDILKFFMEDIDSILASYEPGRLENKPDVQKQLKEIKEKREKMIQEETQKQIKYQETMQKLHLLNGTQDVQSQMNRLFQMVNELTQETGQLKEQNKYLEDKLKQLITENIQLKQHQKT